MLVVVTVLIIVLLVLSFILVDDGYYFYETVLLTLNVALHVPFSLCWHCLVLIVVLLICYILLKFCW